jgi:hypothetical protein
MEHPLNNSMTWTAQRHKYGISKRQHSTRESPTPCNRKTVSGFKRPQISVFGQLNPQFVTSWLQVLASPKKKGFWAGATRDSWFHKTDVFTRELCQRAGIKAYIADGCFR